MQFSTANLTYQMNRHEWRSPISELVLNHSLTNKSNLLIGEDIEKNDHASLRSMSDPNAEGQPDTYKGTYWYAGTVTLGSTY
jgi:Zn-dependent metalloprotease